MTRLARFARAHLASGWVLASAWLAASSAGSISGADPPLADAARRAEFQERDRLWREAQQRRAAGKTAEAIAAGESMLAIERKLYPLPADDFAISLDWLGRAELEREHFPQAEKRFREALEIRSAAFGAEHWKASDARLKLQRAQLMAKLSPQDRQDLRAADIAAATCAELARAGKYSAAIAPAEKCRDIRGRILGEADPDYALAADRLATMYEYSGGLARALPLFLKAIEIRKAALGDKHPDYATSLNNLAALYDSTGDYARAEPLYRQALDIRKVALGETHPDYAKSLNNRALLELTLGRSSDAEKHARQGAAIQRQSLDLASAVQSERQQLAMAGRVRGYLGNFLSAALAAGAAPGEMYDVAMAWKGAVSAQQQQMRAREHALASGPDSELAKLFAQLDQKGRKLAAVYRYTPKPEEAAQLQQAMRVLAKSVETLQQQLARLDPDFHRAWAERSLTSDKLRQSLPEGTALVDLLEYSHYIPPPKPGEKQRWERRYLAFVLRRDQPVACFELGAATPINGLVGVWRQGFGQLPAEGGKLPGDELRRIVWQPLAAALAGAGVVLVSPDGALAQLPWAALPGDKPGTFLIEQRQLAVIPVPQMLPELLKSPLPSGPPTSLLLAGDIDYGGDPGAPRDTLAVRAGRRGAAGPLEFPALEASQGELSSIRDWYEQADDSGSVRVLRRRNATEAAFRDQAPGHPWLHLITHGYFAASESSAGRKTEPVDPGLLSSLAFAGANTPLAEGKDDGILTALEVASLDLSHVDTVVLSACETGLGQSSGGEGLLGLQRAFQVAGAKTVVASLWKVPDAATSRLMQRFYKNIWDRKLGRLAALQEAQIFMIHDQASRGLMIERDRRDDNAPLPPYYWAAFVLSGDWR